MKTDTDSETVWVALRASGGHGDRYHLDPECRGLQYARKVTEKPRELLREGTEECTLCVGGTSGGPRDDPHKYRRQLINLDPTAAGLTPKGERHNQGGRNDGR